MRKRIWIAFIIILATLGACAISEADAGIVIEAPAAIGVGDSVKLTVTGGEGGYTYQSSNPSAIKVSDHGVCKASAAGKSAVVTVTDLRGNTAQVTITTVKAPDYVNIHAQRSPICAGETTRVVLSFPNGAGGRYTLTSLHEDIATVSQDGIITGVRAGSASIRVTTYNGKKSYLSIRVCPSPTRISLSKREITVEAGETRALSCDTDIPAAVRYSVSDASVAIVDDKGCVTGISPGECSIIAETVNGLTDTCRCVVTPSTDAIRAKADRLSLHIGETERALFSMASGRAISITVSVDNPAVCYYLENAGTLIAVGAGQTTVRAKSAIPGMSAEIRVSVSSVPGEKPVCDLRALNISDAETAALVNAYPDIAFNRNIKVCGVKASTLDETLDLSGQKIRDISALKTGIAQMANLKKLEMHRCGLSNEIMAALREEYRGRVEIVWTVNVASLWRVRTDATAFSTLIDSSCPKHASYEFENLKYVEGLLAIDLGHNSVKDLEFLTHFPNLKVLILSCNRVKDVSVIGTLKNLEHLELFENDIVDISPLAGLTNLLDLNLCWNHVTDASALHSLTKLERLWFSHNGLSDAEQARLRDQLPNCEMNFSVYNSDRGGWRSHQRYFVIYRMFRAREYMPWDTVVPLPPIMTDAKNALTGLYA